MDGKAELKQAISGLTSMSVAADGRRLVLVVEGVLHLTSQGSDGSINFPLRSYRIPTMFSTVQSAAFGGRRQFIVAGTGSDGLRRLMRMNIDGTYQILLANQWHQGLTIGRLVADPYTGNAMFELQGEAYEVRQNGSVRLAEEMILPSPGTEREAEGQRTELRRLAVTDLGALSRRAADLARQLARTQAVQTVVTRVKPVLLGSALLAAFAAAADGHHHGDLLLASWRLVSGTW